MNLTYFIYYFYYFIDGITMVGFQRLGTVRGFKFEQRPLPVVKDRNRSGSDPLHLYSSSPDEDVGSAKYDEYFFSISIKLTFLLFYMQYGLSCPSI